MTPLKDGTSKSTEFFSSMAVILHRLLGRSIRMEGLLGLMQENCKACSGYPDQVEPLKLELDAITTTVSQLVNVFDKEANK